MLCTNSTKSKEVHFRKKKPKKKTKNKNVEVTMHSDWEKMALNSLHMIGILVYCLMNFLDLRTIAKILQSGRALGATI
jgi:hypothetical protein